MPRYEITCPVPFGERLLAAGEVVEAPVEIGSAWIDNRAAKPTEAPVTERTDGPRVDRAIDGGDLQTR